MSVDFTVVCDVCKTYHHLGQGMGGTVSFGYGSNDAPGRLGAMNFIYRHLYCDVDRPGPEATCGARELRIVMTDNIPDDYERAEDP